MLKCHVYFPPLKLVIGGRCKHFKTIERLELAATDIFDPSVFARAYGSWHVGIEMLAVLAFDLELTESATVFDDKLASDSTDGID